MLEKNPAFCFTTIFFINGNSHLWIFYVCASQCFCGKTVFGNAKPPRRSDKGVQLRLF